MQDAQRAIARLELNGVNFDLVAHGDLMATWEKNLRETDLACREVLGAGVSPSSGAQVAGWLEATLPAKTLKDWPRTTVHIRPVFELTDDDKEDIYPDEPDSVDVGVELARTVLFCPPAYAVALMSDHQCLHGISFRGEVSAACARWVGIGGRHGWRPDTAPLSLC
jgi:hypothetical protein